MIQHLFQAGADINIQDNNGQSMIYSAINAPSAYLVKQLLKKQCILDAKDIFDYTPEQYAEKKAQEPNEPEHRRHAFIILNSIRKKVGKPPVTIPDYATLKHEYNFHQQTQITRIAEVEAEFKTLKLKKSR